MKSYKVLLRFMVFVMVLIIVAPGPECMAQRRSGKHFDREVFGKPRKSKPFEDKIKAKGSAGKAVKKQEQKEDARKKAADKTMDERRARHFKIQSPATQQRMIANQKNTEEKYKAKAQKQKKEQSKPKKHKYRTP